MNGLSNLDVTCREYSSAPADDLIIFWQSKVKVTAGCRGGEASTLMLQRRSPSSFCLHDRDNSDVTVSVFVCADTHRATTNG